MRRINDMLIRVSMWWVSLSTANRDVYQVRMHIGNIGLICLRSDNFRQRSTALHTHTHARIHTCTDIHADTDTDSEADNKTEIATEQRQA